MSGGEPDAMTRPYEEEILYVAEIYKYLHTHKHVAYTHFFVSQLQRPRAIFFHKSISSGETDTHGGTQGKDSVSIRGSAC